MKIKPSKRKYHIIRYLLHENLFLIYCKGILYRRLNQSICILVFFHKVMKCFNWTISPTHLRKLFLENRHFCAFVPSKFDFIVGTWDELLIGTYYINILYLYKNNYLRTEDYTSLTLLENQHRHFLLQSSGWSIQFK